MKTGKEMAADVFAEIELRQSTMKKQKKIPTVKITAMVIAMILILTGSVFAIYRFTVPKELEDNLGTKLVNIKPILSEEANDSNSQIVTDTVETDGCTVKFEAIADAEVIKPVLTTDSEGNKIEINVQDKFAIFTIRSNDGSSVEEKYKFNDNPIGYCVGVPGYSPSSTIFEDRTGDYYDKSTNTLIVVCLINEVEAFSDEKPYIVLFSGSSFAKPDFIRMGEDGQPYFTEQYNGIKAIFDLPLDPSLADKTAKEEMLKTRAFIANPDYSQSDKLLAMDKEFRESGTDLSPFIGDNEWLGRYPLQFGKVQFSEVYFKHRNDWKEKNDRLLTADELDKIAEISSKKLYDKFGLSEKAYSELSKEEQIDYDIMIKEKVDTAVYSGGLPEDAEYITLPDDSKAYYCHGFVFLHIGTDGRLSMVIVPNHRTVIEIFGLDSILNTEDIPALYNPKQNVNGSISPVTLNGWFIDNGGIDFDDPVINDNNRDSIESFYNAVTEDLNEYDAMFDTISNWSSYPGTVEVIG